MWYSPMIIGWVYNRKVFLRLWFGGLTFGGVYFRGEVGGGGGGRGEAYFRNFTVAQRSAISSQ